MYQSFFLPQWADLFGHAFFFAAIILEALVCLSPVYIAIRSKRSRRSIALGCLGTLVCFAIAPFFNACVNWYISCMIAAGIRGY
jgi:hypothetical protein